MRTNTKCAGYSLLELMVVLAISALVLIVAVPTVGAWVEAMTLANDARTLAGELRLLRQRALDRQTDIVVVRSGSDANALAASDGTRITLAPGTEVRIAGQAAGTAQLVIAWHGATDGRVRLSRGDLRTEIRADRLTGRFAIGPNR